MRVSILLGFVGLFLAASATAEIYECPGPDGKTIFTSRKDACPGAAPRKLKREVQRVAPSAKPRQAPAAQGPSHAGPDLEAAQEAQWRAKKQKAEQEQHQLERSVRPYSQIVKWCNRGASMHARDRSGVPIEDYDCDKARAQHEKMQKRLAELDQYLASGLAEDCRRAGCLPGWIR